MSAVASLASAKPAAQQDTPPTVKLLIGGEFVESQSKEWRDIVNPATQEVLARVPFATAGEVDAAIRSAHAAFATWKNTPVGARMRIMLKFQALIREHSPRIARTLTAEQGKTLPDFVPTPSEIAKTRRWVMVESHLIIFIPLAAVLMARGIGM